MDAIRKIQNEQLDDNFRIKVVSPLSLKIIAEAFSPKFKLLSLHNYNAKTYPYNHLANFHATMLLHNINDMIPC